MPGSGQVEHGDQAWGPPAAKGLSVRALDPHCLGSNPGSASCSCVSLGGPLACLGLRFPLDKVREQSAVWHWLFGARAVWSLCGGVSVCSKGSVSVPC